MTPSLSRQAHRNVGRGIYVTVAGGVRFTQQRDGLGELMANGLKPPIPKRPSWIAYVIVFPMLAGAILTSPIWWTMYLAMRAIRAAARKHQDGNGRPPWKSRRPIEGSGDGVDRVATPETPLAPVDLPSAVASGQAADHTDVDGITLGH